MTDVVLALAVAQCSSGWGDGTYASWVGWDAEGGVSLVMTDFAVVGDPWERDDQDEPAPAPAPSASARPAPVAGPSSGGGFWSTLFGGRGR